MPARQGTWGSIHRVSSRVQRLISISLSTAVLTLIPLFQPDTLPFRSISFASDSDYVDIGRSSKREAKNLIPAHHNACFDSRVMSRNHARFGVCVEKKVRRLFVPLVLRVVY